MQIILFIVLVALGGWISRMCGGGRPRLPWGLDQWLYAIPYALVVLFANLTVIGGFTGALALVGAMLGKRTGHGQYLSIGRRRQPPALDEKLDFIVRFFMGPQRRPDRKRDLVGMLVTGTAVGLLPALFLVAGGHVAAAALVLLSGSAKCLGYWFGDRWAVLTGRRYTTLPCEILTGCFGWGLVAAAMYLLP